MANLRIQTGTINGQCVERVLVLTPEGVWTPHPTRGTFQPCGSYPPLARTGSDNIYQEPIRRQSLVSNIGPVQEIEAADKNPPAPGPQGESKGANDCGCTTSDENCNCTRRRIMIAAAVAIVILGVLAASKYLKKRK